MRNKKQFPKTLADVTVGDYMFIRGAVEASEGNDAKLYQTLVKYFNDGKDMPLKDSRVAVAKLNSLLKETPTHVLRFTHKGVDYGFIPNLENISAGELIDIEDNKDSDVNIHKIMSILYRPVTKTTRRSLFLRKDRYEIESYKGTEHTCNIMREVPVEIYLGAMVFFYLLGGSLLEGINTSIKTLENKMSNPN